MAVDTGSPSALIESSLLEFALSEQMSSVEKNKASMKRFREAFKQTEEDEANDPNLTPKSVVVEA